MRIGICFFYLLFCISVSGLSHAKIPTREKKTAFAETTDYPAIVKEYLSARIASWQLNAAAADVEKTVSFYADSIKYIHVLKNGITFSLNGKEELKKAFSAHMGETKDVSFRVIKHIDKQNVVMIEYQVERKIKKEKAWADDQAYILVNVIEFDTNNKIKKITEYL